MRKYIITILFFGLTLFLFSQQAANYTTGNSSLGLYQVDTFERIFIVELNSRYKYYIINDAIVQPNLIFTYNLSDITNPQKLYQGDTVFINFFEQGRKFFKGKIRVDNKALNEITRKTDRNFFSGYSENDKYAFNSSVFKNSNGIEYLIFYAKLTATNIGAHRWKIPKIYSENCADEYKYFNFCEREFSNTYFFTSILEFHYYYEYNKLKGAQ